ncbi:MAG: DEAD/DEAH box helicase family protein [Planctomycetaceae bacterium]
MATRISFDQGTLLLSGMQPQRTSPSENASPWVYDHRCQAFRCDAMHYRDVLQRLMREPAGSWTDEVASWRSVHFPRRELNTLRPDQTAALDAWMVDRRGVVVMPTGTGKTEVALHAIVACSCSVLIVAPVRDLMYQWHERIRRATGVDAGIIGDGVHRVSPVCVTTYDSAAIHMPRLGNHFQFLVFDECHHLPGPMRQDAARMSAAPFRLGLTATPERRDGGHLVLDSIIGPRVYSQPIHLARGKTLADYDIVRIPVHLLDAERERYEALGKVVRDYMRDRREQDPEYDWQTLCSESGHDPRARAAMLAFHTKRSIEDRAAEKLRIIEDLFRLHAGEPVIVFCGSNAMARDVSIRFLIPCLLSHCRKRERQDILSGLKEGRYPALVANRVLDEGVDLPEVNVAIVVGGGSGTRQALQRLGRVLRKNRFGRATFYEIVTMGTRDDMRSRARRRDAAFRKPTA